MLDSMVVKMHPEAAGALKKSGPQAIGKSRGRSTANVYMAASGIGAVVAFCLSPGQAHDTCAGRVLLESIGEQLHQKLDEVYCIADRACQ